MTADKKIIEEFSKDLGINVYELIDLFEQDYSRIELSKHFNITEYQVRQICSVLQLRLKQKHRKADLLALRSRLEDDDSILKVEVDRIENENALLRQELKKKTKQLVKKSDELTTIRKVLREEAREEMGWEILENKIAENFPDITIPEYTPKDKALSKDGDFIVIADSHLGVKVSKEECGNEYGSKEFNERMDKAFDDFLTEQRSENLTIFLIGDLIEAAMNKYDQLLNAEHDMFEQIDIFCTKVVEKIVLSLRFYKEINIVGNVGNHSRMSDQHHFSKKYLNYETFLFRELRAIINAKFSDRVTIEWHPSTMFMSEINGTNVLSVHGDLMKSVNDQTIKNVADYAIEIYDKEPDQIIFGHFHKLEVKDVSKYGIISCRSLKAWDNYFAQNSFKINKPGVTSGYFKNRDVKILKNLEVL